MVSTASFRCKPSRLPPKIGWYILGCMHACHFCKTEVRNPREVFRGSTCPACGRDLKICLNCGFYSPGAHWDCSETIDEPVNDKDRSNFCSFFSFKAAAPGAPAGEGADKKQQARRKIDQLFGNES
jgi:hypothetical protein